MVKTKLGIEQIIAGALLLGFDSVSNVDITLLSEDFLRKNPNYSLDGENPVPFVLMIFLRVRPFFSLEQYIQINISFNAVNMSFVRILPDA